MTVLFDSSAWIEYFRGSELSEEVELILFSAEEIIASTVNISEVYRFMLSTFGIDAAEDTFKFILQRSFVLPVTIPMAKKAAELKHEKAYGLGDALILATARLHGAKILTCDKDFKKEPDVIYLSAK